MPNGRLKLVFDKVKKNQFGFYELRQKPSAEELRQYYSNRYYQESAGSYEKTYSEGEIRYINNKIMQKYIILRRLLGQNNAQDLRFLDVGCGEGWALRFFKNEGWEVKGLDYSEYGCKTQNPDCLEYIEAGEITDNIRLLINGKDCFHVVWLDNVLEHIIDPLLLLEQCTEILHSDGILVIEVPNDYSVLQQYLFDGNYISEPFWLAVPDHISYFNSDGLKAICRSLNLECRYLMGDFPIDMNLFNENTNYVRNKSLGKPCHKARITIENMLHNISVDKTNELYRVMAELGLGRQITGFFQKSGIGEEGNSL